MVPYKPLAVVDTCGLPGQGDLHANETKGTMSSFRSARNSLEISEKVSVPAQSTHLNSVSKVRIMARAAKLQRTIRSCIKSGHAPQISSPLAEKGDVHQTHAVPDGPQNSYGDTFERVPILLPNAGFLIASMQARHSLLEGCKMHLPMTCLVS